MKSAYLLLITCSFLLAGCNLFSSKPVSQPEPTAEAATPDLFPEPESEAVIEAKAIADLLTTEPSLPAGEIEVLPAYNDGSFATGTLSHTYPEAVANKIWIVAKVDGEWELVHYGSPAVPCTSVDAYEVPTDIVEVCISTEGDLIER